MTALTRDQILAEPACRRMDALVAEFVMGWHLTRQYSESGHWITNDDQPFILRQASYDDQGGGEFSPSTSIADAFLLVDKMKSDGRCLQILWNGKEWSCSCSPTNEPRKIIEEDAETLPLAICRMALRVSLLAVIGEGE